VCYLYVSIMPSCACGHASCLSDRLLWSSAVLVWSLNPLVAALIGAVDDRRGVQCEIWRASLIAFDRSKQV